MGHDGILVIGGKGVVASDSNNGGGVGEVVPDGEEEDDDDVDDILDQQLCVYENCYIHVKEQRL